MNPMRSIQTSLILVGVLFSPLLALFAAAESRTGALLQALPDDGAWVTFQVNVAGDSKDVGLTWTLRSVGTVLHEGKPCRFLELEQKVDNGPQEILVYALGNVTWRVIVPEAAAGDGKDPLARAVKIWRQFGDEAPLAVTSLDAADPILAAILRGPVANRKVEERPEKINWQRGELECRVVSGQEELDFFGAKLRLNTRVLRQDEVPFGVAGLRQEIQAKAGETDYTVKIHATLRDHGTGAKAKLPQLTP
jgi:hypothetical protein